MVENLEPGAVHIALIYNKNYLCHAVLINDNYGIAAASYVVPYKNKPKNISIEIGRTFDLGNKYNKYTVVEIKEHPDFDPTRFYADIAVLTVSNST